MSTILRVSNISKSFKSKRAVDSLSFELRKGQILGLLGPNGSGKTTTLGIILSLLKPDSGEVSIFESSDLDEMRKRCGVLLESTTYYPDLTAAQNLKIVCEIKGVPPSTIENLLERVGLIEERNNKLKTFSLGMKQRLLIASVLVGNPELIILDEPTNGMDPKGIIFIRDLIKELASSGKTVLVASHLLNEMERLCSEVVIMQKGRALYHGPLPEKLGPNYTLEDYFLEITQ